MPVDVVSEQCRMAHNATFMYCKQPVAPRRNNGDERLHEKSPRVGLCTGSVWWVWGWGGSSVCDVDVNINTSVMTRDHAIQRSPPGRTA